MNEQEPWMSWSFPQVLYYDRAVDASNRIMSVRDGFLVGWQIRRGTVDLSWPGGRLRGSPGEWVLIPPGLDRRHRFSTEAVIRSIRCTLVDAGGHPPLHDRQPLNLNDDGTLTTLADALAESRRPRHDLCTWAAQQAAVLQWGAAVCQRLGLDQATVPPDARVAAAQRLVIGTLSPAALPWDALRDATGLSRPHLDRLFRQHSGLSVRAWCEARLLDRALAALGDPEAAVKRIADDLGFGDASHFCRWFRQHTGSSPARWRRQAGLS